MLIFVEATMFLIEDIATNPAKKIFLKLSPSDKTDNRLEKMESFELYRRILEDVYNLHYR